ncbi:MAG: hypothetical protein OEW58_06045 [Gammaproteobacteria bacterium]|nr:hypothetical protein [Gammaproteobacteria bacterium]
MDKSNFQQDTRYSATLRDSEGKLRPSNFYVLALHDDGMVVRLTEREGILRKITYSDVIKIVSQQSVSAQNRYCVPGALLTAKHWTNRKEIQHYSSSPHMGK